MESDDTNGDPAGVPATLDAPGNNLTPIKEKKTAETRSQNMKSQKPEPAWRRWTPAEGRRLRSGGSQVIRIERVDVRDGGQAVIGNVKSDKLYG
jgi:hypothetical protein